MAAHSALLLFLQLSSVENFSMKTFHKPAETVIRRLGSKFLTYARSCSSHEETDSFLEEIRKKFPDATHHCYAWRLNPHDPEEFSQDDGEPSGTAGLPILNVLRSFELINAMIIVVRYYGGTKLGKSGLIEAYGEGAKSCVEESSLAGVIAADTIRIKYNYPHQRAVEQVLERYETFAGDSVYLADVSLEVHILQHQSQQLLDDLAALEYLGITAEHLGDKIISQPE